MVRARSMRSDERSAIAVLLFRWRHALTVPDCRTLHLLEAHSGLVKSPHNSSGRCSSSSSASALSRLTAAGRHGCAVRRGRVAQCSRGRWVTLLPSLGSMWPPFSGARLRRIVLGPGYTAAHLSAVFAP